MKEKKPKTYPRPEWLPASVTAEKELCPDCFKVVGERSRYDLVCTLGKLTEGMTVTQLTDTTNLTQPTVTHHLKTLESVGAVSSESKGREKIYSLNRSAHCFEECKIPFN